jgi:predicted metal-dependent hydrolase
MQSTEGKPLQNKMEQLKQTTEMEQMKRAFVAVMATVAKQIPRAPTRQQILSVSIAIEHLEEATSAMAEYLPDEELVQRTINYAT